MYPDRREPAAEGCALKSDPEMRIVVDTYEGETSGQPVQARRKQHTARSFGAGPSVVALINGHQMKEVKAMTTPQTALAEERVRSDRAEELLRTVDESTKPSLGISLFHLLTLGSIGASIALFLSGKKEAGIFVGLWPPTFQALKSVVDKMEKR
jgi:hypothetical protein